MKPFYCWIAPALAPTPMDSPEEIIKATLESIRESILQFKFLNDSLQDRADKIESDITKCQSDIHELRSNTIRTDERIAAIQRYLDAMSADIRTVRNSVLGAAAAGLVIGIANLAFSTLQPKEHYTTSPYPRNTQAAEGFLT